MNGSWQLDLPTIQTVLRTSIAECDKFTKAVDSKTLDGMVTDFSDSKCSWTGGAVGAWSWLLDIEVDNINIAAKHMQAGILGVANATQAYCLGQEDMANSFNAEMEKSASSGNFDYFNQHGYFPGEKKN